ncbi:MAG: hypothetical protein ACYDCI_12250 [Candidatus Limnocylindrales bacterium]
MSHRPWLGSVLLTALLAGCGGATTPAASIALVAATVSPSPVMSAPPASPTPAAASVSTPVSPTGTPVPTPDVAALGAQYLAMATPLNATVKALNSAQGSATKVELKVIFAKYAVAYKGAIASLKKIAFPTPIQADVDKLITTYGTMEGEASKLAANPDHDPGTAITEASAQAHRLGARIRAALGLPPPPNL